MSRRNSSGAQPPSPPNAPSTSSGSTSLRRGSDDSKLPSVSESVARLRECEDFRIAMALQEEEFANHYKSNRNERQIATADTRLIKAEQRAALEEYLAKAAEIARHDEEYALQLQRQLAEEERQRQLAQARLDEELARKLQMEEEARPSQVNPGGDASSLTAGGCGDTSLLSHEDAAMAKDLQRFYLKRYSASPQRVVLDERTQNELNRLMMAYGSEKVPNEHDIEATTCGLPRRVTADTPLLAAAVDNVPSSLAIVTESDALMRGLVERLPPLPTYAECCRDDAVLPEYSAATTRNDIGRLSSEGASNRKILETESVKRTLVKTAGAGNTAFETNCALANSLLFAPNDDKIEPDLAPLLVKNKDETSAVSSAANEQPVPEAASDDSPTPDVQQH